MSLTKKAAHGVAWVALSTVIIQVFSFVTNIILARLLAPADFGLLAIGLLVINTIGIFRDLGFGASLIYKNDNPDHIVANTAFILLPFVALVLFLIAYFSAPHIALFFDNLAVKPIIQMLSLTLVISSFGTVPSMLIEKELEFKKKVLPETLPIIGYSCVSIFFAMNGYGVWSLVYGQIVSAVLTTVLIWLVFDWRPTFKFDLKIAWDLFSYGKHILASSIVAFIITNVDNAIIGKMLGMSSLGFYMIAYTISNLPATYITRLVDRVMFPTYSKLQNDQNGLKSAYLKTLKYVSVFSIPMAFGIFVIASDFVSVVLGEQWMPSVVAIQILSFFGLSRSIVANNGSLRNSLGRPDIAVKLTLFRILIFIIIFYPFTIYKGLVGMSLAVLISSIIPNIYSFKINEMLFGIKFIDVIKSIYIFFLNSLFMTLVLCLAKSFLITSMESLIFLIIMGMAIYVSLCYMTSRETVDEIFQIISITRGKKMPMGVKR